MQSPAGGLTLGVGGAADDVGQFGLQAGVGGAVPARRLVAARAQRQHALQRRVGPQALALVDGQRRGVVDEESAVLDQEEASEVNVDEQWLFYFVFFQMQTSFSFIKLTASGQSSHLICKVRLLSCQGRFPTMFMMFLLKASSPNHKHRKKIKRNRSMKPFKSRALTPLFSNKKGRRWWG